jgi:hypothetical protein
MQLYIRTRALRITAKSMPAREGLYAGMSRAFPHRYHMSGFLAAKARATLQDGNPDLALRCTVAQGNDGTKWYSRHY